MPEAVTGLHVEVGAYLGNQGTRHLREEEDDHEGTASIPRGETRVRDANADRLAAAGHARRRHEDRPIRGPTLAAAATPGLAAEVLRPARERFAAPEVAEVPDFQRHVLPLMGRLGCNTRVVPRLVPGPGGLPPLALRLRLQGRPRRPPQGRDSGRVDLDDPEAEQDPPEADPGHPPQGGQAAGGRTAGSTACSSAGSRPAPRGSTNPVALRPAGGHPGRDRLRARRARRSRSRSSPTGPTARAEDVTCISPVPHQRRVDRRGRRGRRRHEQGQGRHPRRRLLRQRRRRHPGPPARSPTRSGRSTPTSRPRRRSTSWSSPSSGSWGSCPSEVCTDAEFLRRVSLDLTGTLPTPEEVEAFLADPSPDKRARKVDELLARPTYAAWWTTKLCDITGDAPQRPQRPAGRPAGPPATGTTGSTSGSRENMPYDKLVAGHRPGHQPASRARATTTSSRSSRPTTATRTRPTSPTRETMPYFWAKRNVAQARGEGARLQLRLPRRPARMRPVPQAPVRPVDPGRLQPVHGVLQRRRLRHRPRRPAKRPGDEQGARASTAQERRAAQRELDQLGQAGEVVPWQEVFVARRGQAAAGRRREAGQPARPAGSSRPRCSAARRSTLDRVDDPRQPLMDWMRSEGQPLLRPGVRQPGLGRLLRRRDHQPARRHEPGQPAEQRRAARLPGRRVRRPRLRHEVAAPRDRQQPGLPAELAGERDQPARRAELQPGGRPPAPRRGPDRRGDAGDRRLGRRWPGRRPTSRTAPIGPKGGARARPPAASGDYAVEGLRPLDPRHQLRLQPLDEPNLLQSIYLQNDQEMLAAIDRTGGWLVETTGARPGDGTGRPATTPRDRPPARGARSPTWSRGSRQAEGRPRPITVARGRARGEARRQLKQARRRASRRSAAAEPRRSRRSTATRSSARPTSGPSAGARPTPRPRPPASYLADVGRRAPGGSATCSGPC